MKGEDFKYKGERFLIEVIDGGEVVFFSLWGEQRGKDAEELFSAVSELKNILPNFDSAKVLIDLTGYVKTELDARRIYTAGVGNIVKNNFIAVYGASAVGRVVVGFITFAAGKKKLIQFFKTKKEALAWLKRK